MIKPTELRYIKKTNTLSITFEDGFSNDITSEYLRCFSPSAEVKGHGPGQEKLQINKEDVAIDKLEPVGNYAVRIIFDDGHDTGIYSWEYLYELGSDYAKKWNAYLQKLKEAGYERVKQ